MQSSLDGCAEDSYFSANFPASHSYVDCVAQPVEHPTFNQVVVGSSPTAVTILPKLMELKKPKHLCSGLLSSHDFFGNGGERGIRTPDSLATISVFETDAINRSATSPTWVS